MSDIFATTDALKLLSNKNIIFLGDSNVRSVYKDLVWLLNGNTLITATALKKKLESSFLGDALIRGEYGHRGRDFEEIRKYEKNNVQVEFYFLTRCYNNMIQDMVLAIKEKQRPVPEVIVINSCLWDICRWGPNGVAGYKENLVKLIKLFKSCLPAETLVIWTTTLPVSTSCKGGFLIKQVEFLHHTLRFEIMEANMFAQQVVMTHGFDVLDFHHHLHMQIHRRADDGIHWLPTPVRHMTNLILTHIALSWGCPLPGNFQSPILEKIKYLNEGDLNRDPIELLEEEMSPQISTNTKKFTPRKSRRRRRRITHSLPAQVAIHQYPDNMPVVQYDYNMQPYICESWRRESEQWPGPHMRTSSVLNGPVRRRKARWRRKHKPYKTRP